ncbi:MAG: hypothetical protein FWF52_07125 [Candidatus Azobacteroides sp.]|nr:hypothetical protein [Candidatus Azobacteroides sp.]
MDKLSEYVPLIIIIGTIIYSVIKGSSRKKAEEELSKTTLPGHTGGEEIYFPETIEAVGPSKKVEPAKSRKTVNTVKTIKSVKTIKKEAKESKVNKTQSPIYQQTINPVSETAIQLEPEEPEIHLFNLENVDEVKKAFIYTEIFNRKEY